MTIETVINRVAEKTGVTERQARTVIGEFLAAVAETLAAGEEVQFRGFGTFHCTERAPTMGRDLRTGTPIKIPAMRVARFRPGKSLRAKLNPSPETSARGRKRA